MAIDPNLLYAPAGPGGPGGLQTQAIANQAAPSGQATPRQIELSNQMADEAIKNSEARKISDAALIAGGGTVAGPSRVQRGFNIMDGGAKPSLGVGPGVLPGSPAVPITNVLTKSDANGLPTPDSPQQLLNQQISRISVPDVPRLNSGQMALGPRLPGPGATSPIPQTSEQEFSASWKDAVSALGTPAPKTTSVFRSKLKSRGALPGRK